MFERLREWWTLRGKMREWREDLLPFAFPGLFEHVSKCTICIDKVGEFTHSLLVDISVHRDNAYSREKQKREGDAP